MKSAHRVNETTKETCANVKEMYPTCLSVKSEALYTLGTRDWCLVCW